MGDAPQEKMFLSTKAITVTNSRFIVGSQTFAVRNITSVASSRDKERYGWAFVWALVMIGCFASDATGAGVFFLGCAGYVVYKQMTRPTFVLLHTAGGEQKAYSSTNASEIAQVVNALNDAIVHRG